MKIHDEVPGRIVIDPVPTAVRRIPGIKKLPPDLRKPRIRYSHIASLFGRLRARLANDSQFLRSVIQGAFILLCIWIGVEFYLFMKWGTSGGAGAFVSRPPGAEGFLPISALISLKYWLQTGIINEVHPAGLFIFIAILLTGFLLKKAFCSWLCPVGTLSESLWMLGRKLFGRNLTLPRWLDYPLRSLKYLLLAFFGWAVGNMDIPSLRAFIYSPYNKVADVKMYLFFAQISGTALWVILALIAASVVIKNFWCRFLCPYGALLGLAGLLSPLKIRRTASTCIDCELCTKACPASIRVHALKTVRSDECSGCLACVDACPVRDTLEMRPAFTERKVPGLVFGLLVAGIFVAITGAAILAGHWNGNISNAEYLRRIQQINSPIYQHFQGKVPEYGPED